MSDGRADRVDRLPPAGWQPCGAVTGVGSVPMVSARAACAFVRRTCPEVPFWPQLARRNAGEGMIAQFLGPVADLLSTVDGVRYTVERSDVVSLLDALGRATGKLDSRRAAGFYALVRSVHG